MGRAYEVRKASIQKTGALKAKLYSMYAREIYQAAKNGGTSVDSNSVLKRLIDKAKKDQVPSDIIKRAIDKVNSGIDEHYTSVRYEIYGPNGSNIIADGLTDNINRTLSDIRTVLNKTVGKMGSTGSVAYMYDHLCVVSLKGLDEETVLNAMIDNDIEVNDVEIEDEILTIYASPSDLYKIKEVVTNLKHDIIFEIEEITMLAKDRVILEGEDLQDFQKMISMLEEVEDVQNVYHNVVM